MQLNPSRQFHLAKQLHRFVLSSPSASAAPSSAHHVLGVSLMLAALALICCR
jgi:hypothetical protein